MAFQLVDELAAVGVDKTVAEEIAKNPKAAAALEERLQGYLRQSDYDRKMNSGKAELDAAKKTLQEQLDAFEIQKQAINDQYIAGLKSREQAEAALATVRAKAKTAAELYGVPLDKELFGEGDPVIPQKREDPQPGPGPDIIKRVDLVENLFRDNVNLQVEMMDVARQHSELFPDKPLVMKELLDDAVKQRRTMTQVWDDKYGATAKREEIKADKYRAEGAAKATEALEKKYSGQQVNGIRTDLPMGPLFTMANSKEKGLTAPHNRDMNGAQAVANAVAAFASGKYRAGGNREASH